MLSAREPIDKPICEFVGESIGKSIGKSVGHCGPKEASETIRVAELTIEVSRKPIKNVHLSVHPPHGRVTLVAPQNTRLEVSRAYVISRLGWIRAQQSKLRAQARQAPREFIARESHTLWGRRYLLSLNYQDAKPSVTLSNKWVKLCVRAGSTQAKRAQVMHTWHKSLLHAAVKPLIEKWQGTLGVTVSAYFLQRMKTQWGSCNPAAGTIRLNTELVKKPKDLLEYVVVHEMAHLIEPTHSARFVAILDRHYPSWRDMRAELNALPLSEERWHADSIPATTP